MKHRRLVSQLQAGADDTRIRILELALRGDPTATEVHLHLAMSQPRVAHHLKILVAAGLLSSRRDGRFMRYTLPTSGFEASLVRLILEDAAGHEVTVASAALRAPAQGPHSTAVPAASTRPGAPVPQPVSPPPEDEPEETGTNQLEDFLL